jgi:hypothetical protein
MKTLSISLSSVLLLCGCVAQIPFHTVQYPGAPGRTSEKTAAVAHNEIDVTKGTNQLMVPAGVVFVPVLVSEGDVHQFNKGHQAEFAAHLRAELERLRIFNRVTLQSLGEPADLVIRLEYKSIPRGAHNSFAMSMRMTISGGRTGFSKDYFVVSDEGDSTSDKWTTNASEGKVKLVRRLLGVLIPDIRAYAESNG